MNMMGASEKRSRQLWLMGGLILTALLGMIDYLTGPEIAFSLFYLIPVSLVAWFTGRLLGILTSLVGAIIWLIADIASGRTYSHPLIEYWNATSRFGFFIAVAWLLATLKNTLQHEQGLARQDPVTDALNSRFFKEFAQMEINRTRRYKHPFTVAYIDLDHFKTVNDNLGHNAGDRVLRTVARSIKHQLRNTDVVGRLGGDEFACLLLETGQDAAKIVLTKLLQNLLEEMRKNDWPVTFSVGVLTCIEAPQTVDEMIHIADDLMYSVKKSGKNGVKYSLYTG